MIKQTPGLSLVRPEAGVVAFPGFVYNLSSEIFTRELIGRYGVFVLPGSVFETENHFRINLGREPERFLEAVSFIGEYCRTLL